MEPFVRHALDSDLDTLYEICVRTADSGGDARGMYYSDRLMGDLFAAPYFALEPEHAFVLDDGSANNGSANNGSANDGVGTAVGYIVGTADTGRFVKRYRDEWIPLTADRLPRPPDPPVTPDDVMLGLHYWPERMLVPELSGYPAHLHIDLLPGWQGRGFGRALVARFLRSLREAGVPAVHLGMLTTNVGARAFYDRLGFAELLVPDPGPLTYLGRSTT